MLTYVLANYEYGRAFELTKVYHQTDMPTRDQLVVAQVMHGGTGIRRRTGCRTY